MITPKATVKFSNFCSLIEDGKWGQDTKYIGTLVFPEGADLEAVEAEAHRAWEAKFPGQPIGVDPFSEYEGQLQLKVKSKFKPKVVDRDLTVLEDVEDFDGKVVKAAISARAWEFAGKRGVSFSISALQLFADEVLESDPTAGFVAE